MAVVGNLLGVDVAAVLRREIVELVPARVPALGVRVAGHVEIRDLAKRLKSAVVEVGGGDGYVAKRRNLESPAKRRVREIRSRGSAQPEIEESAVVVRWDRAVSRYSEVVVGEVGEQRAAAGRRVASGAVAFFGVVEERKALRFLCRELRFAPAHEVELRVETVELVG